MTWGRISKKVTKKAALRRLGSTVLLLVQVGADGHVVTTFLPLAGDVVILRPFLRRTFRDLIRDFRHVAVVAGKFNAVERHHLRCSGFVQLFNFGSVWQGNGVTATFGGLRFEETAHFSAWCGRGGYAWNFHFLRFFTAFRYRRTTRFGICRDGVRALQNAFLRIFFIDERGNALVAPWLAST